MVVDNYDFKIDSVTGDATGVHGTNVMFVQPEKYKNKPNEESATSLTKKREISEQLSQICAELMQVYQCKCPIYSKREPPAHPIIDTPVNGTSVQRARSVIHTLSRANNDGTRSSPHEQLVLAYCGAQSCRHPLYENSKPYYHTTYNQLPSKSVMHDIMVKLLVKAMREKYIPFSFLVGNMPTYKTILQLKAVNPKLFRDTIPILGTFHHQMSYIYAIYKRFKGSRMAETLVTAEVIVEGSVDQAL